VPLLLATLTAARDGRGDGTRLDGLATAANHARSGLWARQQLRPLATSSFALWTAGKGPELTSGRRSGPLGPPQLARAAAGQPTAGATKNLSSLRGLVRRERPAD
jgi:hypothetical protein